MTFIEALSLLSKDWYVLMRRRGDEEAWFAGCSTLLTTYDGPYADRTPKLRIDDMLATDWEVE